MPPLVQFYTLLFTLNCDNNMAFRLSYVGHWDSVKEVTKLAHDAYSCPFQVIELCPN